MPHPQKWRLYLIFATVISLFVSQAGFMTAFAQDDDVTPAGTNSCAEYLKSIRLPPQKFSIRSSITNYLKLANGTELLIPANSFGLDDGPNYRELSLVNGMIDLEVTEVVDPMAFVLYNIPMIAPQVRPEKPIAAHGAIRIKARWAGLKLRLGNSNAIWVLFENHPAVNASNWHGSHSASELMVWKNAYFERANQYAGKLTPQGPMLDDTYPSLGTMGKASPFSHLLGNSMLTVEDVVVKAVSFPDALFEWSKVYLWVDGNGHAKRLEGVHGGLASNHSAARLLASVQWDVSNWDTLKPIMLQSPPNFDLQPATSAVSGEFIITSNTLRAIENKAHLEEMLTLMPLAKVQAFLDHALGIDDLGWSLVGQVVEAGHAKAITLDLGIAYSDAKVFMVMPQDTIVVEAQRQSNGTFQFPAVPDGRMARIIAMAYSADLGTLLGTELIATEGGLRQIAMKSLPWSSLQAMQAKASTLK